MTLVATILGGLAFLASGLLATRLYAKSRREGGAPERLVALAITALFCFAYPLAAVSRAPGLDGTHEGSLIFTIAMIALVIGISALYRFPQIVFRPSRPWAIALRHVASTLGAVAGAGCAVVVTLAQRPAEMIVSTRPWAIALMVSILLPFAWNAVESTLHFRQMRRRLRLQLSDPIDTHRFLLWAISSWSSVLHFGIVIALRVADLPIRSPLPMAIIASSALFCLLCTWLAFMMPRVYRIHVVGARDPDLEPRPTER